MLAENILVEMTSRPNSRTESIDAGYANAQLAKAVQF
jgi:hypothetical protein